MRLFLVIAGVLSAVWLSPAASAIPGYEGCPPGGRYHLDVRGVTCEYGAQVASAYDMEGAKFQDVNEFACYTAQYDVYPIVLTCISGDNEIVVSET